MKTCSFRQAKPRSFDEGLFCIDEPDMQYNLTACDNCPLCVPPYDNSRQQQQTTFIQFGPNQTYRFLNGYQTILNCPAYCHSKNIIYVMACPCGQYEYIGETSLALVDRLWCKSFLFLISPTDHTKIFSLTKKIIDNITIELFMNSYLVNIILNLLNHTIKIKSK